MSKLRIPSAGKPVPGLTLLKKLSPDRRMEVMTWLRDTSYADAQKKIAAELGIKIGRTALSSFFAWQSHQERTENYNQLIAQFEDFYAKANPNASRDKVREMGIAFFMAEATANQDRSGFVSVANLDLREREGKSKAALDERKLSLSETKYRDQVREKSEALQRELKKAKAEGGISEETFELVEQKLKLF